MTLTKKEILKRRVREMYWAQNQYVEPGAAAITPLPSWQIESLMEVIFEELFPDRVETKE